MKKILVLLFAILLCLGLMTSCSGNPEKQLVEIRVTAQPTKTTYWVGDTLDLSGMVITAYFSDGTEQDVTKLVKSNIELDDELTEEDTSFSISYTANNVTKTIKITITVIDISSFMLNERDTWFNNFNMSKAAITEIHFLSALPDGVDDSSPVAVNVSDTTEGVVGYLDGTKIYIVGDKIYANVNCRNMFQMFYTLTELEFETFDTSYTTNMDGIFFWCDSLTELDLSSFDTSNVETMESMFGACRNLQSLDLSSFNTENVTNMASMFSNCAKLETITFGENFNTDNVNYMNYMFATCYELRNLTFSPTFFTSVEGVECTFIDCDSMTELDLRSVTSSYLIENSSWEFDSMDTLVTIRTNPAADWSSVLTASKWSYNTDTGVYTKFPII